MTRLPPLPPGVQLFTANTSLMYTNIKTASTICEIAQSIHQQESKFSSILVASLAKDLSLVIKNDTL